MNCGADVNCHLEISVDRYLKQLNEKMLSVFLFNLKNNNLEEKGLTATTLQEIPRVIEITRGNS